MGAFLRRDEREQLEVWDEEDVELLVIDTSMVAYRAWIVHERLARTICSEWHKDPKQRKIANAAYSSQ